MSSGIRSMAWLLHRRRNRQILQQVVICAILGITFFIISINMRTDAIRYSAKPLVKLKRNGEDPPRMLSRHRLFPSNVNLLDLPSFHYLMNNDICSSEDIFIVIIIHSAPQHFTNRDTIRNTWGKTNYRAKTIKTAFLVAEVNNRTLQRDLELENAAHRDMVQGSFVDSYKNLTYKHVMGLKWASTYCAKAEFILKMDDDIFINIFRLMELLEKRFPKSFTGSRLGKNLACYHQRSMPVVRDPLSKWFVTKEEFPNDTFDDYCSGWAYFVSPKTAGLLARTAAEFPYFWVDDVHLTGTVAKSAGVGRIRINEWFSIETQPLLDWTRSKQHINWNLLFAPTWGDMELTMMAHRKALRCHAIHCPCCYEPPTEKPKTSKPAPITGKGIAFLVPFN